MLCSPNCDSHLQVNRYFFLLRLLTFWQTTVVTNMLLIIKTSNENYSCFQRFGEKRFGDKIGLTHVNTSPKLWSWVVSDHGDPGKNRGSPRKAWRLWNELKEEVQRSLNLQPQWRPKCPLCQTAHSRDSLILQFEICPPQHHFPWRTKRVYFLSLWKSTSQFTGLIHVISECDK